MSEKRPKSDKPASSNKRPRKSITLAVKLDILRRFAAGEKAVDIARTFGLPATSVRTIRVNAEKIQESAQTVTPLTAVKITRSRSGVMEKMESLLCMWIENQNQHNIPISMFAIQEKARNLFQELKSTCGESSEVETFGASRGWFERFKKRNCLHSITTSSESTNIEVARSYPGILREIIEEGGYTSQQIFNVDETELYWKRLPAGSFVSSKNDGENDHMTLLLGGNASGDFKLKPLVVYHTENPSCIKGHSEKHFPVIWQTNKASLLTAVIFQDWFNFHFSPAVEDYCAMNNLPFKALLILDNSPGHPLNLDDLSENIQVIFLPSNVTTLLQPMDQGVTTMFKACYLRRTLKEIQKENCKEKKQSRDARKLWENYNLLKALDNIADSWQEIKQSFLNLSWEKIWPDCVTHFQGFEESMPVIQREIVGLAKKIGLGDLQESDIVELLEFQRDDLTNEELITFQKEKTEEIIEAPLIPPRILTSKRLAEAFKHLEAAIAIFRQDDPDRRRSCSVNRSINESIVCYKELYLQKQKKSAQLNLNRFIKPCSSKSDEHEISENDNPRMTIPLVTVSYSDEEEDDDPVPIV